MIGFTDTLNYLFQHAFSFISYEHSSFYVKLTMGRTYTDNSIQGLQACFWGVKLRLCPNLRWKTVVLSYPASNVSSYGRMNFWKKSILTLREDSFDGWLCLELGRMKHNYRGKKEDLYNLLAEYEMIVRKQSFLSSQFSYYSLHSCSISTTLCLFDSQWHDAFKLFALFLNQFCNHSSQVIIAHLWPLNIGL